MRPFLAPGALCLAAAFGCGPGVDEAKFRHIVREELNKEAGRLRKAKHAAARPRPSAPGLTAIPTGFPGIRKVGPYRYEVDRSLKDKFPIHAAQSARIVPAIRNGKPSGFKLFSIRRNSLFYGMGFQNGDVVRSVNGIDITSADMALKAYGVVKIASTVTIQIVRRGKPLTLTYVIK